ncbi:hypothetical protein L840_1009, partial [Mycobacterium sp. MAC_011194_8550]
MGRPCAQRPYFSPTVVVRPARPSARVRPRASCAMMTTDQPPSALSPAGLRSAARVRPNSWRVRVEHRSRRQPVRRFHRGTSRRLRAANPGRAARAGAVPAVRACAVAPRRRPRVAPRL